ncbi:528_t:CDS:2, partial [Racocetra fulgida]
NDDELPVDDDNDRLIDELQADIEALNFPNIMYLEEYINYLGKKDIHEVLSNQEILKLIINSEPVENKSVEEEDDSMEISQIKILEQYIVQKDFSETAQSEYDDTLLKLQNEIRKIRIATFKQTNIE